jgi:hypothetical protein
VREAELRVPLAIPVIGGLIFSTILTLMVVPVLYRLFEIRGERAILEAGARRGTVPRPPGKVFRTGGPPEANLPRTRHPVTPEIP